MEHTPEPWRTGGGDSIHGPGEYAPICHVSYEINDSPTEANLRRIVACVNKLAGWSIEDLEDAEVQVAKMLMVPSKLENQMDITYLEVPGDGT